MKSSLVLLLSLLLFCRSAVAYGQEISDAANAVNAVGAANNNHIQRRLRNYRISQLARPRPPAPPKPSSFYEILRLISRISAFAVILLRKVLAVGSVLLVGMVAYDYLVEHSLSEHQLFSTFVIAVLAWIVFAIFQWPAPEIIQ